jgi:hypothetical protein
MADRADRRLDPLARIGEQSHGAVCISAGK